MELFFPQPMQVLEISPILDDFPPTVGDLPLPWGAAALHPNWRGGSSFSTSD